MLLRDGRSRGSINRGICSRPRNIVVVTIRSTQFAHSVRGVTSCMLLMWQDGGSCCLVLEVATSTATPTTAILAATPVVSLVSALAAATILTPVAAIVAETATCTIAMITSPCTASPASKAVGERLPAAVGVAGPWRLTRPIGPMGSMSGSAEAGWASYSGCCTNTKA